MTRCTWFPARDHDATRPAYNDCDEWDKLVRHIRARDKLRAMGATDGVVVNGAEPVYRSSADPTIEVKL